MDHLVSRLLGGAALACALGWVPVASAQGRQDGSHPVVQALPSEDNKKLSAALVRIGRDPRDLSALIDAGDAARGLQDHDAAIGFYKRAEEVSSGNTRVLAGLGSAFVNKGDPVGAIPYFDAAEKAGVAPALISADRGLAYDLVGDNLAAQRYYALALPSATGPAADELRNRLAVSQAIGGDVDAAYKTLLPLLNRQDKPGWRTRAFTLAIVGETDQAVDVVGKILPGQLAQNIAPYLRYMPRLTKAQQAAAANLGRFPRASEIGRDDARIAAYAPPRATAAGAGLIPKGEPLGGGSAAKVARAGKATRGRSVRAEVPAASTAAPPLRTATLAAADPDRVAPPEPKPTIERGSGELPPVARSVEAPKAVVPSPGSGASQASAPIAAPARVAQAASPPTPAQTTAAGVPARPAGSASPGFDLGRLQSSQTAVASSSPTPAAPAPALAPPNRPPEPGPQQRSLSEIFADIGKPTVDAMPASGAVDIRLITPAAPPPRVQAPKVEPKVDEAKAAEAGADEASAEKAKAKVDPKAKLDPKAKAAAAKAAEAKAKADAEAKAKKPSHPSRIWVQIGVGRSKDAIAFDWRRYTRENAALLKARTPYVSEMGRTNRILVGPFATQKAASAFLADAKKQGFADALPWTSPAGQVVDPLSAK
ncbi:SPOR domain-containing protein [Novosphingobium resinovorum]|uniref:SPOR domain-containing protein n=1 Tax=Novosphingobium resinovorum TaxID=158500 RepID=UPI002ED6136B|nr:SPOR domain-containing protein [Novosphingobium resinovorum]